MRKKQKESYVIYLSLMIIIIITLLIFNATDTLDCRYV